MGSPGVVSTLNKWPAFRGCQNTETISWFPLFGSASGSSECHQLHSFVEAHATWYRYLRFIWHEVADTIWPEIPSTQWEFNKLFFEDTNGSIRSWNRQNYYFCMGNSWYKPWDFIDPAHGATTQNPFNQSNMQSCLRHSTRRQWPGGQLFCSRSIWEGQAQRTVGKPKMDKIR